MGQVHMVHFGANPNEKHFLFDIEGDVNEGQKRLISKSQRGPFASSTGRSTIMDRSSHVIYRKRNGALEITVSRGVIQSEIDLLMNKLAMHRTSVPLSNVVLIKGFIMDESVIEFEILRKWVLLHPLHLMTTDAVDVAPRAPTEK